MKSGFNNYSGLDTLKINYKKFVDEQHFLVKSTIPTIFENEIKI